MCEEHHVQNRPRLFIHLFSPVHLGSCVSLPTEMLTGVIAQVITVILKPERIKMFSPPRTQNSSLYFQRLSSSTNSISYVFNFNGLCPFVYPG